MAIKDSSGEAQASSGRIKCPASGGEELWDEGEDASGQAEDPSHRVEVDVLRAA